MHYETQVPPPELAPFVDCIWVLEAPAEADPEPELVVPDGKTELIVHFGDDFLIQEDGTFVRQERVLLGGQLSKHILLKPTGAIGVLSVRFKPAGAARFFDFPFADLVDKVIALKEREPQIAAELQNQIGACSNHQDRFATMIRFLTQRLSQESKEDLFVRQACEDMAQSHGELSMAELADKIGFSERQLERKFKAQVGISPKNLARIIRFQRFFALSKESAHLTLADAALSCGYYDQSHFIRDFTRFSGTSPLKYLKGNHAMSDHLTTPTAVSKT